MKHIRSSLGIVFYDRTVAVAEVHASRDGCQLRRSAEYTMPDGKTVADIASLQSQFTAFLKENGFKSNKAVVGLAARQIMSTKLKIPPVEDVQARRQTIQMHLERKMGTNFHETVYDYQDSPAHRNGTVLALMTLQKTTDAIKSLLTACKISPLCVTATSLGLNLAESRPLDCNIVDYPNSLEVFLYRNQSLHTVLNISKKTDHLQDAATAEEAARQIKRALWAAEGSGESVNYTLWSQPQDVTAVHQQFSGILSDLTVEEITSPYGTAAGTLTATAAQLAFRAVKSEPMAINFLKTHQQTQTTKLPKQWILRIALGAAVVVLLLGIYFYGWYADSAAIADYQDQIKSMKTNVEAAEEMISRVSYARRWFSTDPVHLDNLRELTLAFPQSSDIWLTSLAVDASLNQVIAGRATREEAILDVVDQLKSNPQFKDIKLLYIRKMGKNTNIMTFAINFNCRGEQ